MPNVASALIVAAGQGSRLRPFTEETPKPLLEVGGECLLERSVRILRANGISDITIVVGYLQEQIRDLFRESVDYIINEDFASTNNMVSMFLGREILRTNSCLYLYADLWYDPELIVSALDGVGDVNFVVDRKACDNEAMKVRVVNGLLTEADKEIPLDEAFGEWTGIIRFEPAGADVYLSAVENALTNSKTLYDCAVVRPLAAGGLPISYTETTSLPWIEIDTHEDLESARLLARNRH